MRIHERFNTHYPPRQSGRVEFDVYDTEADFAFLEVRSAGTDQGSGVVMLTKPEVKRLGKAMRKWARSHD